MNDSFLTIPVVDGDNLKYFKGLYSANPNEQDLIESLATHEFLDVDHLDVSYSQRIHRSIEVKDLVRLQSAIKGGSEAFVLAADPVQLEFLANFYRWAGLCTRARRLPQHSLVLKREARARAQRRRGRTMV